MSGSRFLVSLREVWILKEYWPGLKSIQKNDNLMLIDFLARHESEIHELFLSIELA